MSSEADKHKVVSVDHQSFVFLGLAPILALFHVFEALTWLRNDRVEQLTVLPDDTFALRAEAHMVVTFLYTAIAYCLIESLALELFDLFDTKLVLLWSQEFTAVFLPDSNLLSLAVVLDLAHQLPQVGVQHETHADCVDVHSSQDHDHFVGFFGKKRLHVAEL